MAFRTNKVPAIEERTVSGSSVSFNSAFALPLKACKVSFSATESGSGTKSPSNPYTISGVSSLNVSANSVPVSVNFGDTYYGGELDLLTGKLTINYLRIVLDGTQRVRLVNYRPLTNTVAWTFYYNVLEPFIHPSTATELSKIISDKFKTITFGQFYNDDNEGITLMVDDTNSIGIRVSDLSLTTETAINNYLANNNVTVVYPLITPQTVQLSPTELSSILGNNTFSTDTGTLEITFSDLQEKSASGSVASFNTALAMPLVEGITEFMHTQASGTPSPSNPLPITGVDKINLIKSSGLNLFDGNFPNSSTTVQYMPVYVGNGKFTMSGNAPANPYIVYCLSGNVSSGASGASAVYSGRSITVSGVNGYITIAYRTMTSGGVTYNPNDYNFQLQVGSSATPYEPYSPYTVTLIDLDGTRYGGYVDVVGKKLYLTYLKNTFNLDDNVGNVDTLGSYKRRAYTLTNAPITNNTQKCNVAPYSNSYSAQNTHFYCSVIGTANRFYLILPDTITELNGIEVVYPLATHIEIPLSDIPILSTIIGNNSFASDSGIIELKYKDLDIAKRGNFREVFKLP